MPPDPIEALRPILARLGTYLQSHPELSRIVAGVARGVADWTDAMLAPTGEPTPIAAPIPVPVPPPPIPFVATSPPPPPVDLSQLDLAKVFRPAPSSIPSQPEFRGPNEILPQGLTLIVRRSRAKAEAARLVAQSPGAIDRVAANDLIASVYGVPDCFLWMFDPGGVYSDRPKVWTDLAGAFDTAAAAAELLAVWDSMPDSDAHRTAREVLYFAAEAQSVLYTAVSNSGRRGYDPDQLELYISIKDRTKVAGIFVDRYMTTTDPADAGRWSDLLKRITEYAGTLRGSKDRLRHRKKALDNLKYKASRLREFPEEWSRALELLDELVRDGLAPSNSEVREWLLPVIDRLPDDLPLTPAIKQVIREIDRYQASRPIVHDEEKAEPASAAVSEVRRLLAGRAIVLIGGLVRPDNKASLVRAFDLDDVLWISTDDHASVSIFEAPIARPEVAVVLLAIRWSSHSYGDVQAYCDRYGKLLVRLPGGYNPNQVAHQILTQVGERLRTTAPLV